MANLSNINNKFIVASDGKVGIGTTVLNAISGTNPTLTLGGTGISGGLILQKAGTDTARLYENAGNMVHQGMTGIGHHFYVNAATQAMVIDTSGNVGIGTDSPSSTLDVRGSGEWYDAGIIVRRDAAPTQFGTISQYNGSLNLISVVGGGGGNGEIMFSNHNAATGTPTERMRIDSSGDVTIQTSGADDIKNLTINSSNGSSQVAGFVIQNDGANGYIHFKAGAGNATPTTKLTIGNAANSGNVGIGTDSPGYKLSVANASTRIISATYIDGANGIMSHAGAPNYGLESFQVRGDFISFWTDYDTSHYQGTEKMRIDQSGNVGIGVASGIDANLRVDANSATLTQEILKVKGGGSGGAYGFLVEANNGDDLFKVDTLSYNSYFTNGNVGIGTTGPVNKLGIEVAANSNTKAINIYSKNTSPNSYTSIGSQYSISNTYVESEIRFGNETQSGGGSYLGFVAGGTNTGNTEKMRITSGGNVVINYNATGGVVDPVNSKFTVATQPPYNYANSKIEPTTATFFSDKMTNNDYNSILQLVSVRASLTSGQNSNGYLGFSTLDNSNAQGVIDAGRIAIVNENGVARNSPTALSFWTNTPNGNVDNTPATEKMRIGSSGDVKITTNGKFLQGVRNTGSATIDMIGFVSGTDTLQIKGGTSGAANAISFYDTGGFLGTWYNGNFGIGTTSPGVKLQVQHDQAAESNVIFMNNSTSAGAAIRLSLNVGNPAGDDPMISFNIGDGGLDWTMGVDNSDSDKFKISGGTDSHNPNLGTNDQLVIDSSGNLTMTGDVIAYSDKKLKKNIKTLDGSKVYKMRGVSFDRIDTGKASSGVIAQEIQKIAPELISESNDTLGVAYGNISGYLIEAIKELKAEIEELKSNKCNCNK